MDEGKKQSIIVADGDALDRFIKTDNTHILPALYDRVVIPEQVYKELTNAETPQKVRDWVERQTNEATWLKVVKDPLVNPNPDDYRGWGETQAIAVASQYQNSNRYESVSILLEDRRVIARAERESLRVNRGLFILDEADRRGLIRSLPREIERLEEIPIDYRNETMKIRNEVVPMTAALKQQHYERRDLIRQLPLRSVPSNQPSRQDFIASFPSGENGRLSVSGLVAGDDVKELMSFAHYEELRQQRPGEIMNVMASPTLSPNHCQTPSNSVSQTQTHSIKF